MAIAALRWCWVTMQVPQKKQERRSQADGAMDRPAVRIGEDLFRVVFPIVLGFNRMTEYQAGWIKFFGQVLFVVGRFQRLSCDDSKTLIGTNRH
ncbi:hypothetical protein MFFC18_15390 [Mariniblastus fucicola]|uniref:Uncharacterized protein n=1 Tax=Mariniblastus fucicola TaxID=980251 RepID=A0A5B9PFD5_9BACT|nr:hypothetical protein MFFC18_15390 [Mariniblastus fucicola]